MDFLFDGPDTADITFLFAHGAGAAMDAQAMTLFARAFSDAGLRVARFEFGYMAARRTGTRKPPPRAETLISETLAAVEALGAHRLLIGGKSMGGRVASMAADGLLAAGRVVGLACLGYPFHPPGKPSQLRTSHLETLVTPTLIFQGTRDPFGSRDEVATYALSPAIDVHWMEDGDHDLKPRKRETGATQADYAVRIANKVAAWASALP